MAREPIASLLDLERYPIDRPKSPPYEHLLTTCRVALAAEGLFNLTGFMRPETVARAIAGLRPKMASESFLHTREHNIYFKRDIPGLSPDHPALQKRMTVNRTLCADQLAENPLTMIYEYQPLADFLASVMEKPALYIMNDPLARFNVMAYRDGETLNWHFDRSEFTSTLLLQAPDAGGEFIYRSNLRTADDPNYAAVAELLSGRDDKVRRLKLEPGTLNVFKGRNTAHKVNTVRGPRDRIIAVLSYYEKPNVRFSAEERLGFYGRAA